VKVIWSARALLRLKQIQDYIAEDHQENAKRCVAQLIDRWDSLVEQPYRGRPVPEYPNTAVREVREGDYRIIYRVFASVA